MNKHLFRIGICTPSSPGSLPWKRELKGLLRLRNIGIEIEFAELYNDRQLTSENKLKQLYSLFENPEIDAIMCYWGGTIANSLLEEIDYIRISQSPKPFIGYSDCTVLLHALRTKSGIPTIHGPGFVSFTKEHNFLETGSTLLQTLTQGSVQYVPPIEYFDGQQVNEAFYLKKNLPYAVIREGKVSGQATGGHIALISALIGTEFLFLPTDSLLFLECSEEYDFEQFQRYLYHLKQNGLFHSVRGVIISKFMHESQIPKHELYALLESVIPSPIPILAEFDSGHTDPIVSVQFGKQYHLDTQASIPVTYEAILI